MPHTLCFDYELHRRLDAVLGAIPVVVMTWDQASVMHFTIQPFSMGPRNRGEKKPGVSRVGKGAGDQPGVRSKGSVIWLRSLRVSTRISGPSSRTTAGLRSRGTCTGLGSLAMAC